MYVKLFSSILDSSVWDQGDHVLRLWITLLAMSDRNGCVYTAPNGLARRAKQSREDMEMALAVLTAPDPDDSSGEIDGRRVERIQGGWRITNYQRYRDLVDPDVRRDQTKLRVRKHRNKARSVTLRNAPKRSVAPSEEMRSEESRSEEKKKRGSALSPASELAEIYAEYPLKKAPAEAKKAIQKAIGIIAKRPAADRNDQDAASWLRCRVSSYADSPEVASARADGVLPYPASWFNKGRYDDDENEWYKARRPPVGRLGEPDAEKQARVKAGWSETFGPKGPDA